MEPTVLIASILIFLALLFDFTNGFHDSSNQVATIISSRTLTPEVALIIAAIGDFLGAYFLGTSVAKTIGRGILDPALVQNSSFGIYVMGSALLGAILWNFTTWYFGLPSSSSHALIGGLLGAFVAGWGFSPIQWGNMKMIILIMLFSPIVGFLVSILFTRAAFFLTQWSTPKVNRLIKKLQVLSLIGQSLAHGTNDAQKTMGVITFILIMMNFIPAEENGQMIVPHWVILSCSIVMALGILTGGWRIIKTLGSGLYRIRPIHGLSSQVSSGSIMYLTAFLGFPISTTQVISSSVAGAGAAYRPKKVRWMLVWDMVIAWIITMPAAAIISALIFFTFKLIFI